MAHSHAHLRHRHSEKARHLLRRSGYKTGGAVRDDEASDRQMIKSAVHKHERHDHPGEALTPLKHGGAAHGHAPHRRLDRKGRAEGGRTKKKGHTQVNVLVAPQGGGDRPVPVPVPHPMPAGPPGAPMGAGAPAAPPPRPAPPPPMGGGLPPGGMPARPMKRGGRACKDDGGPVGGGQSRDAYKRDLAQSFKGGGIDWDKVKSSVGDAARTGARAVGDLFKGKPQPQDDQAKPSGEKRGGTVRKHKAHGGTTAAGPLDYSGAEKQGNAVPSWKKNDGGSNERERAHGGRLAPHVHMEHGSGGGLGRIEKAEKYGASHRRN